MSLKILICQFLFYLLLASMDLRAQVDPVLPPFQSEQDACGAIPICGNFTCPFVYNGPGVTQTQAGFLLESNSVWLRIKIVATGTLAFTINPLGPYNNFDFVIYNITPPNSCFALPGFVNYNVYPSDGATGLTAGPNTSGAFNPAITANAGDEYLILVEHSFYSIYYPANRATGFSIDFTESTATLAVNDSLPHFSEVKPTCNKSQKLSVQMSEPVRCSSIAGDGSDFYITPSLGSISGAYGLNCTLSASPESYTNEVSVQFSSPLPLGTYWLHAKKGMDGNSLLDECELEQSLPDSIEFTVDPYDQVSFTSIDSPACQFLVVGLSHKVLCDSIAPNGSDFQVSGPSAVVIHSVIATNCDTKGLADTIMVELQDPIAVDGTYYLLAKKGTDHNTLVDTCSGQQLVGDQVAFKINSFNSRLNAAPDTILCHADTIRLSVNSLDSTSPQYVCGPDTGSNNHPCFSVTREITGLPGTVGWGGMGGGNGIFIGGSYKGFRKQLLIRASELKAAGLKAGVITQLSTEVNPNVYSVVPVPIPATGWPPPYPTYSNFGIKIGCTSENSLYGQMESGLTTVYTVTDFTPVGGINEFPLDIPYVWDGLSNLLVEVCSQYDSSDLISAGLIYRVPAMSKFTTTSFNSCLIYCSQNNGGCGLANPEVGGSIPPNSRPDFRFTICSQGNTAPGPYQWSSALASIDDSTSVQPNAFIPSTTSVFVNTYDRFGCVLRDSLDITVSELDPSVSPVDTSVCIGNSVQLIVDAGTAPGYYNWITPAALSCLSCSDPVASPLNTTEYSVVVSDQWGCSDTISSRINIIPLPEVKILPGDTIIKYGSSLQLRVNGAAYYSWFPGGSLDYANTNNPTATPLEPTDYVVVGLGLNGCWGSDTIHVDIDYTANLFVPSAFSPGNDGKNDLFRVANLTFQQVQEFRVFNRWGQEVFSAIDNRGWDGRYKGLPQDMGVYQYLIRVGTPDGKSQMFKGDVTLFR